MVYQIIELSNRDKEVKSVMLSFNRVLPRSDSSGRKRSKRKWW